MKRATGVVGGLLAVWAVAGALPALGEEPSFFSYKPNFFLAGYDRVDHDGRKKEEAKFQISLRKRPWDAFPLYFGFTQTSFWQVFDARGSAPFRESNYNPEVFVRPEPGTWNGLDYSYQAGVEHESNGQPAGPSRSWNRYYVWPQLLFPNQGGWAVALKWWGRFKENPKEDPAAAEGDDNPDILDYLGNGELYVTVPFAEVNEIFLMARRGREGRFGAFRVDYFLRLRKFQSEAYFHAQLFSGYGESLIDYNEKVQRLSIGFAFNNAAQMLAD